MYIKQSHKYLSLTAIMALAIMLSGCYYGYNDQSKRNKEFSDNMYSSIPLEPYSQTVDKEGNASNPYLANGRSAQSAPEGTVPRDSWYVSESYTPFPYDAPPSTDYDSAGMFLTTPLSDTLTNGDGINCSDETFARGKRLYETYCVMCHGAKGDGKGKLVTEEVFGAVPSYKDSTGTGLRNLSEGKMFYTLTYGKGIMGSYASQMTPRERWEVICYIQKFQQE